MRRSPSYLGGVDALENVESVAGLVVGSLARVSGGVVKTGHDVLLGDFFDVGIAW